MDDGFGSCRRVTAGVGVLPGKPDLRGRLSRRLLPESGELSLSLDTEGIDDGVNENGSPSWPPHPAARTSGSRLRVLQELWLYLAGPPAGRRNSFAKVFRQPSPAGARQRASPAPSPCRAPAPTPMSGRGLGRWCTSLSNGYGATLSTSPGLFRNREIRGKASGFAALPFARRRNRGMRRAAATPSPPGPKRGGEHGKS